MNAQVASVFERLGTSSEPAPDGERRLAAPEPELGGVIGLLRDDGARYVTTFATDAPERSIVVVLALRGELILVRSALREQAESLSSSWPAAAWAERELTELHGVRLRGLPPGQALTAPDADVLVRTVSGLDVFALPFGPVRSGIFEAIQFQIETGGEDVLALQTRPFFKHRGMEARFAGLTPDVAVHVA